MLTAILNDGRSQTYIPYSFYIAGTNAEHVWPL